MGKFLVLRERLTLSLSKRQSLTSLFLSRVFLLSHFLLLPALTLSRHRLLCRREILLGLTPVLPWNLMIFKLSQSMAYLRQLAGKVRKLSLCVIRNFPTFILITTRLILSVATIRFWSMWNFLTEGFLKMNKGVLLAGWLM